MFVFKTSMSIGSKLKAGVNSCSYIKQQIAINDRKFSVKSFGTEDRETQFPVAPQNQVYEYILFRGSDIKDIRVVNSVSSLPNDPAIVQV